jgi:tRNA(Ile2) C34 agmatinyltransferase TiaS
MTDNYYENDPDNLDFCPVCDAESAPMGQLGNRLHYRCRACGMMWSTSAEVLDPPEQQQDQQDQHDQP